MEKAFKNLMEVDFVVPSLVLMVAAVKLGYVGPGANTPDWMLPSKDSVKPAK